MGTVSGLLEGTANSTVANAVAYIGAVGTAFTGWSQALTTGIGTFADRIITDNTEGGDDNTGALAYQQGTEGAPPATQTPPPPSQPDRRRLYDDCPLECRDELLELFRLIDKANAGPYDAGLAAR